ncbi:MAG: NUDIX hydrolase [Candidatus Pacebacteria bacterium]|nr:NUDIX hydrolase [Candidatus Paceibacterota bacterium]
MGNKMIHLTSRAIFLKNKRQILVLKDLDSDYFGLPGGGVEEQETPIQGLLREIKEEISLNLPSHYFKLVGIEYRNIGEDGEVIFIFQGQELSRKELTEIAPSKEIGDARYVDIAEAYQLLTPTMVNRLSKILLNFSEKVTFLENGKEV